jgi:hypothetical protein
VSECSWQHLQIDQRYRNHYPPSCQAYTCQRY